jgi:hypothetical protein
MTFPHHLEVFKGFHYNVCPCGQTKDGKYVPTICWTSIISTWDLDVQQGCFQVNNEIQCCSSLDWSHGPCNWQS